MSNSIALDLNLPMGCFAHNSVSYAWTVWFGILVFESAMVGLALYKCILNYRDPGNTPQLLKILLRDSILFYGGVALVALINCLVWAFGRVSASPAGLSIGTFDVLSAGVDENSSSSTRRYVGHN